MALTDDEFMDALSPLTSAVEASGFILTDGPQPTWMRSRADQGGERVEKVVIWRHPRRPSALQGYVASSVHAGMIHLRLFDPDWQPERMLPGSIGKNWEFDDHDHLQGVARELASTIWPRVLGWFEQPTDAETLMLAHGRIPSVIRPGPMLEYHRRRAQWLRERDEMAEAEYVEQMIVEIEALYEGTD